MKKFIILIPIYNDWKSVFKLLGKIDIEISQLELEFSALIINDGSTEEMPKITGNYKNFKSINLINMKKNQGHTRCYATGIKYLSDKQDFDYLIAMDGDGEDRPEEIKLLVDKILENTNNSVVAKRVKRTEGPLFQLLYQLHKIITLIFTGRNINFGHYSCLTKNDVILLSSKKSLWSNFAGTLKKNVLKLNNIPCIRGRRYFGPSKMSIIGLVIHSFSIIAVFKYQVLIRSLAIYFFLLLFLNKAYITVVLLQSMLVIFTIIIFITSRRENSEAVSNSANQIKDIINIHTV
jgi:glycosyltransferase involved in cell wall biosynthesis